MLLAVRSFHGRPSREILFVAHRQPSTVINYVDNGITSRLIILPCRNSFATPSRLTVRSETTSGPDKTFTSPFDMKKKKINVPSTCRGRSAVFSPVRRPPEIRFCRTRYCYYHHHYYYGYYRYGCREAFPGLHSSICCPASAKIRWHARRAVV